MGIKSKLYGHTIFLMLPVKNMLCSEVHCQKVLIIFRFHIKQSSQTAPWAGWVSASGREVSLTHPENWLTTNLRTER